MEKEEQKMLKGLRLQDWTNPSSSLSVENEQADTGWDGRTHLARPNSQARIGTRKFSFPLSS